jgi:maleate isomerase
MAPPEVGVHAARAYFGAMGTGGAMDPTIALEPVRAFAAPPHIDDAAELLSAAPLNSIGFGFTSSAYVIGAEEERAMIERLQGRTHGIPVVATCSSTVQALRVLDVTRIALVTPPWFDADLTGAGRQYYRAAGFDVLSAESCELPSDQKLITPEGLYAWVVARRERSVEAVVIDGNGFRAVGVIETLEAELGRPVLTANQVLFWAALKAAGENPGIVRGYGRLFDV